MRLSFLILVLAIPVLFTSCWCNSAQNDQKKSEIVEDNLLYTANWKAVTDLLGSSYSPEKVSVVDSLMEVNFTLKKKEEGEIVFIELVCGLNSNLSTEAGVVLSYKCETPLVVKLSQSDFGADGDESYAHYQYVVPASESISTVKLNFSDFTQPQWTPDGSKGIAMKLENVNAIYLTPDVDVATGGSSLLGVKGLYLW